MSISYFSQLKKYFQAIHQACKRHERKIKAERATYQSPVQKSGAVYGKCNHITQLPGAQRQHHQTINTQRHAGAVRQTGF